MKNTHTFIVHFWLKKKSIRKDGIKEMIDFATEVTTTDPTASTKIFGTRDLLTKSAKENYNLGNFYVMRAIAAQNGLYSNSAQEATYPSKYASLYGSCSSAPSFVVSLPSVLTSRLTTLRLTNGSKRYPCP